MLASFMERAITDDVREGKWFQFIHYLLDKLALPAHRYFPDHS